MKLTIKHKYMDYIGEYFKNKNNAKIGSYLWDLGECEQAEFQNPSPLMKRIICNDGFEISVQAGRYLYSCPRENCFFTNTCLYSEFELGYPNKKEPLLIKYAEDKKTPTKTVYPYVPKELINKVISKHKGLKIEYR